MEKIKLTFFFRKPSDVFHSIEELFANFQNYLSEQADYENVFMTYHNGIVGRLKNVLYVKKNKSQINHITGDINYVALGLPKKNTILTIHDIGSSLVGKGFKNFLIKIIWFKLPIKNVAKITVISEFSKNEILKTFKVNPRKLVVIPNCVSDKFIKVEKKFNSKKPNILIVGTKENKNLSRSIQALSGVNCKVSIVGKLKDSQKKKLEDFNINYSNHYNLHFEDVVKMYQQADILLFPTIYEGFGIPILEAQATGVPVITSDLQPMNQVAGDGALLLNPFNVEDIKNGLVKIIDDENYRNKIVEIGFENVKKYRCKEIAKMYYNLYLEVIKNAEK
ncbi:MAG: glycosyltransferase family 4 protein [Bacteroidales bacterium]|nr:glycosyltransferase family 4 protein [Bacteroidales bacterium]